MYFALGWNLPGSQNLSARRVTLHAINSRLPDCPVKALLNDLVVAEDYVYFADMANHSKHRSVVQTPYSVDLTGEECLAHGLKFSAFSYEERHYQARWLTPVLSSEYARQSELVVQIGVQLNKLVHEAREAAAPAI
jgi:hypothetical protein